MKISRFLPISSAVCLILVSCQKPKSPPSGAAPGANADDLAAERALIEEERLALERERLVEERAALEEEKDALRASREARLVERETDAEWQDVSLEDRQRQLAEREAELETREEDFALREASLSEQELDLAGRDMLDQWEPEPLPEMLEPVADYDTFYEDLQPYGSWYETPDYGYVYQPTVVVQDSSWRPYTRGRWACTNLGWNWVSDEPFGWACFHYGRWSLLHDRGWVWVPGDEWAPSWVCWREGSEHVGWAPLPPETLCHRGRGWDGSVEADFGIGSLCFNFVHRRHMADPPWRHCLPVEGNPHCIQQTNNITNIRYHHDRIIAGGPGYERLRREVGKPWPVYQLETDRFRAIRDLNRRDASVRGTRLAVFAPNLNTRWNDQLKPSRVAGRWDEVKVVRAESGIKPLWSERFREAREKQQQAAVAPADIADKRKQFEVNRQKVGEAQRALEEKQKKMTEERREKQLLRREMVRESQGPVPGASSDAPDRVGKPAADGKEPIEGGRAPTLAERQREAADRMRETRARRVGTSGVAPAPAIDRESTAERMTGTRGELRPDRVKQTTKQAEPAREAAARVREEPPARQATNDGGRRTEAPVIGGANEPARLPRQAATGDIAVAQDASRARSAETRRQQQEQAVQNRQQVQAQAERNSARPRLEETRREAPEQTRQQQEQAATEEQNNARRARMEVARRQQQEVARERLEQARQQQAGKQRGEEAARLRQMEEARELQAQSSRAVEENNRRQQQEQARRLEQDQARQQQEEMRRQQQDQARQQQEEMRRQQQEQARQQQLEVARQQQEEARRQGEERARQQQEERARQQEQARQQQEERSRQQEQARQQQEERSRQQEQARQQEEERSRQQRDEQQQRQQEREVERQERQRGR